MTKEFDEAELLSAIEDVVKDSVTPLQKTKQKLPPKKNATAPIKQPDAPPLTLSFNNPLQQRSNLDTDLFEPKDPIKEKVAYNCTALLKAELQRIAQANLAFKFKYKDPALYYERKTEKNSDNTEQKTILKVGNNTIACYNPGQKYANGKTSLELAAEAILKLPKEKQPKVITLSGNNFTDCKKFAEILRKKGVSCEINILTVDARGGKHLQGMDEKGELSEQSSVQSEQRFPTVRPS